MTKLSGVEKKSQQKFAAETTGVRGGNKRDFKNNLITNSISTAHLIPL